MAEEKKAAKQPPEKPAPAAPKAEPAAEEVSALVPISRVRDYVKNKGFRISPDSIDALNKDIMTILDNAMARAEGNNRQTIKPCDI